jgi:BMFP domain-containing protein YqiC
MKDKDLEQKITKLISFMWKSQLNVLKAREELKELAKMFEEASKELDDLHRHLQHLENANNQHTETTEPQ